MTTSYYSLAESTKRAELNFPSQPELQQPKYEYGPNSKPYSSTNGLTYVYDPDKASWTLLRGDTASQDWVNSQLRFKLDKAGGIVIGDVELKTSSDSIAPVTLTIRPSGEILFTGNGDNKLSYSNLKPLKISQVTGDNTESIMDFGSIITSHKSIQFPSNLRGFMIGHNLASSGVMVVADLGSNGGSSSVNNRIHIAGNESAKLQIYGGTSTNLVDISGKGVIKIPNKLNVGGGTLIAQAGKIETSEDYNNNMDSASDVGVATAGYVRKNSYKPGDPAFMVVGGESTNTEEDVSLYGLWTRNNRFYIRIPE